MSNFSSLFYKTVLFEAFSDKHYSDLLWSSLKTKCCKDVALFNFLALITVFGYEVDAFWQRCLKMTTKIVNVYVSVSGHNKRQTFLQVNTLL